MKHWIVVSLLASLAGPLCAAPFTVTNNNDAGPGSLRDAVAQSNASPGADTISFAVTGIIVLTTGQLSINGPLTITGPGSASLTIAGNNTSRIFSIFENVADVCATPGTDFPVSISGLTLMDGRRTTDQPGGAMYAEKTLTLNDVVVSDSQAKSGGGLTVLTRYAGQTLTITSSTFAANTARPFAGSTAGGVGTVGGGLFVAERCFGATTANVVIDIFDSVFIGNKTRPATFGSQGAGIAIFTLGAVQIVRSRIAGNAIVSQAVPVNNRGAGLSINSASSVNIVSSEISDNSSERAPGLRFITEDPNLQTPATAMAVNITNSTIAGNIATTGGAAGIGVYGNVEIDLDNSTVSNNIGTGGLAAVRFDSGPTNPASGSDTRPGTLTLQSSIIASNGGTPDIGMTMPSFTVFAPNSLIGSVQAGVTLTGAPLVGVDPKLGALMFNGGPTRTQLLSAGSPAIDAGSNPLSLTTDQRGVGYARVVGASADIGAFEAGNPLPPAGFAAGTTFATSSTNATPTGIAYLPVVCPASGLLVISGSGESAAKSSAAGTAFIGMAYSIARDSAATDNGNVVQSSALAKFEGDANRDFLNVERVDSCTPGQTYTYFLTAYATTPDTDTINGSFVWNGRLTSSAGPTTSGLAAGTTFVTSASNAAPTMVMTLQVVCPASGVLSVTASGESAAVSGVGGNAFIGLAYSISRDSTATDNGNVVQSSALASFNGDANRDFLNVQRVDSCTPSQSYAYTLTAYATTPETNVSNASFVWNGRLTATSLPAATGFAAGSTLIGSASNAAPTVVTSMNVTCPASGNVVVSGSGESAALSSFAGNAFIGLAYSIAKDSTATDNSNVVQSSALAIFNGDANRDFLNVQRSDSCTPGQQNMYFLTAYATTPQTNIASGSFVWNGRLVAVLPP